jgi:hypothetical protein
MKTMSRFFCLAAGLAIIALAGGCASNPPAAGASTAETPPKFSHPREITNPYLPLGGLHQDILESKSLRIERTVKPDLHKSFIIGGQTVDALVVEDREFEGGRLKEVALDYIAQDDAGTVYYLGEDVDQYNKDGKVASHPGAWLYGTETSKLGVLMPAHPAVGNKFKSEDVPKITWELDEVLSLSETVTVPAGTYSNCLKIREKLSDGATEYKYYASGVGCVMEVEAEGAVTLRSHQTLQAGR